VKSTDLWLRIKSIPAKAICWLLQMQASVKEKIHSSELDGFFFRPPTSGQCCGVAGNSFAQPVKSIPANAICCLLQRQTLINKKDSIK